MVRLKRLKIHRFRHVRPGTEISFDDEWNVVLGKNGTGKTTLLQLVACAVSSNFGLLSEEPFEIEYDLRTADALVVCRLRNSKLPADEGSTEETLQAFRTRRFGSGAATMTATIDVATDTGTTCHIEMDADGVIIDGRRHGTRKLDHRFLLPMAAFAWVVEADTPEAQGAGERLLDEFWRVCDAVRRFDESLAFFDNLFRESGVKIDAPDATTGPAATRQPTVWFALGSAPLLRERTLRAFGMRHGTHEQHGSIEFAESDLPFLSAISRLFAFKDTSLELRFYRKESTAESTTYTYGPFDFSFTRRDDDIIKAQLLSYGQKRMLAFLYYASVNQDTIIADELVNGFHHEWIETCLEQMNGRQRFLTSQNPLLLDHVPFDTSNDAKVRLICCTSDRGEMVWKNLSGDQADRFYRAYDVGIQYVGEILRQEGLW